MTTNLIGSKLGNYRLERLLGRGRMGVVYLARDEALLRPTAVKLLSWTLPDHFGQNPEAWFLAEARNVARINHPHVVQIYGVAKHGTNCYIAMEYVNGAPADAWIADHGPFPVEQATEIVVQAAGALQAAHDAGVVHRDVKPGNLLVGTGGAAKLGDFGMALYLPGDKSPDPIRAGTPLYTAPEIWRGQPASPATDLYALGATYFYLLTGHPPFETHDLQNLIAAHLDAPVPSMRQFDPSIPAGCDELVQRCLAKSVRDRPQSAQRVAWEARGVLRKLHSVPPPPSLVPEVYLGRERVRPGSSPPPPRWLEFFGFAIQPFGSVDPARVPVRGDPFASVRTRLREVLIGDNSATVILQGEAGSGRTTLANQVMAEFGRTGPVAYLGQEEPGKSRSLRQQVARCFGVVVSPSAGAHGEIDRILDHLERTNPGKNSPALLVLDNPLPSAEWLSDLALLVRAAAATGSFRLLVIGSPNFQNRLAESGLLAEERELPAVDMPRLSGQETLQYLSEWFRSALAPTAAEVVVTPDAGLLVAHRSEGNLVRINRIVSNMLVLASVDRRRVLSSWDAWIASDEVSDPPLSAPLRPESWPTPEVLQILNERRRESGIAPRSFLRS